MSGKDKNELEELEVTAQPKSIPEELGGLVHESGLSVDPEDLGRQFLADATEQGNFESLRGGDAVSLYATSAALSDEPLTGPNFEGERSVWENTVSMAMENGGLDGAQYAVAPSAPEEDEQEREDGLHLLDQDDDDIDLTESSISEGSLLDHETEEHGETAPPTLRTDDSKSHTKKRGGHARKPSHTPVRGR
jgi:hypothetical protein